MTFKVGDYVETVRRLTHNDHMIVPRHTRGTVTDIYHGYARVLRIKTADGVIFEAHPSELTKLLRRSEVAR